MGQRKGIIHSPTKLKVLTLLRAGLMLGLVRFSRRPNAWTLAANLSKEFQKIDRRYLYQLMREFREDRLAEYTEHNDGTISMTLTERGKETVLKYDIDNLKLKEPKRWDRRWRVVFFDVPEKKRPVRDALRAKLQELGFYELQKSVFVHPYPCTREINFVVEFFGARQYVRMGELTGLTNEAQLKSRFGLVS